MVCAPLTLQIPLTLDDLDRTEKKGGQDKSRKIHYDVLVLVAVAPVGHDFPPTAIDQAPLSGTFSISLLSYKIPHSKFQKQPFQ